MAEKDSTGTPDTRAGGEARSNKLTEDLDLAERFRRGDPEAFDTIFETYSGPLLGFLTRMCGHPEDAREALQDTFMAVFRYLDGYRGEATLKNWIFKIAVRACLKKKRKADKHGESRHWDWEALADPDDPGLALNSSGRDPEALIMDREFREYLVHGVASMPHIYKLVINLRDFEGFSTQEVSRILGIKESTVKVRLHRARLYLRKWLKQRYSI